ncbi:MAG: hypothetical protein ABSG80_15105 [Verrucomicrobiota bacterium]
MAKVKSGHQEIIGETLAKLWLFEQGWDPYDRFLDRYKVDFVLRTQKASAPVYRDIQVKFRSLHPPCKWMKPMFSVHTGIRLGKDDFKDHRPELFVVVVLRTKSQPYQTDYFTFPSKWFRERIQEAPFYKKNVSKIVSFAKAATADNWFILKQRKKFLQVNVETCLNIDSYRNNAALLGQ